MPLNLALPILAFVLVAPTVETSPKDRLECFLNSQSWICREEICAFGTVLYQGRPQRLLVDFGQGTLDLNGLSGTFDHRVVPAVVHWRLAILGSHTLFRHEAGERTFVTLSSSSRNANFACSNEAEASAE